MNRRVFVAAGAVAAAGCGSRREAPAGLTPEQLRGMHWSELERRARGSEVRFALWGGDEALIRLLRGTSASALRACCGVELRLSPAADTAEVVNKLLTEKSAGRSAGGSVDLLWINGENFRAAKAGGVLWGPFAASVPNVRLYPESAVERDFGAPVEGYEAPWQRAQFVLAHDTARVGKPPRTIPELLAWVQAHPGRFTWPAPPDFTGSAFLRHVLIHYGGGAEAFADFDEAHYARASAAALKELRELRPALWRKGETYPATVHELDGLFANGEVEFAMSYNPAFASVRIARGEFPGTVRTFVPEPGTLANYSFLAIPFNAADPAGALAAANFLMSFEHLVAMAEALGTPFPLDLTKLTEAQRRRVDAIGRGPATLPDKVLLAHAMPEPDARYLTRFERDWRQKVLEQ